MIPLQRKHYPYIKAFDVLIINKHSDTMYNILIENGTKHLMEYERENLGKKIIITNTNYHNFYKLSGFFGLVKGKNGFYAGATIKEYQAILPIWTEIKIYFRMIFGLKNKVIWS